MRFTEMPLGFLRCSPGAALLPADSIPAAGGFSGGQSALPVPGLPCFQGHASAVVSERPHGQA